MAQALKKEEAPKKLPAFIERRFTLPDLNEKGIWLVNELKLRFKNSTDGELVNWLRAAIVHPSNDYLFIRTDHAVALAQCIREPLSSRPIVQEQFVLAEEHSDKETQERYSAEGAYLYAALYGWARSLNAYELRIENLTNVPQDMIKQRVGDLYERKLIIAKL